MRILVVGNGGREHALVWKIRRSPLVKEVFCAPGNAGIAAIADCVGIETSNVIELADFASKLNIDLTVVGPELPLSLGIANEFKLRGLRVFAPSKAGAEIETSKAFSKKFMRARGIPTADFHVVNSETEARERIRKPDTVFPLVVKVDGLAAGKGVRIARNREEALEAVDAFMVQRIFGQAGKTIVLEEFLEGSEVTFTVLTDGKRTLPLASSQDYKKACDGNTGPNTGGMGSFSPARNLSPETSKRILTEIIHPTVSGLTQEGRPYKGVLYAGLILTESGPKVLEFNARFGDPEIQSILPRLDTDLVPLLVAVADEKLEQVQLQWKKEHSVSVVIASKGYPGKYETDKVITGLEEAGKMTGVNVFHAGTAARDGKIVTCGGRVLAVNSSGPTLAKAADQAYNAIQLIHFENMFYRSDVGRFGVDA
jgi:phosphoribosylamine--glycine ligase